jgi:Asp/Glu/hydantoin racemase
MIAILLAIVLAALAYWLCVAVGLPVIVGVIAAVLVLVAVIGARSRL